MELFAAQGFEHPTAADIAHLAGLTGRRDPPRAAELRELPEATTTATCPPTRTLDTWLAAGTRLTSVPAVPQSPPPVTPDGRYFIVRGRLWRCTDPDLDPERRADLTGELMAARRDKGAAMRRHDPVAREAARVRIDAAKHALGERGPVWWTDGAPDLNRHLARTTPYATWAAGFLDAEDVDPTDAGRG